MRKSTSGFTIVELLIVIVVIAILAAISVVAYTGIQTRARASAIISDLKATEKALKAYKIASGAGNWWIDTSPELTGNGNPQISSIISAQAEFRNFLQEAPSADGLGAPTGWFYDYDNDTYNGCGTGVGGVNIAIQGATSTNLMQAIDDAMDDGNLSCGKLRYGGGYFLYNIE